jgi:hypothetical protein
MKANPDAHCRPERMITLYLIISSKRNADAQKPARFPGISPAQHAPVPFLVGSTRNPINIRERADVRDVPFADSADGRQEHVADSEGPIL